MIILEDVTTSSKMISTSQMVLKATNHDHLYGRRIYCNTDVLNDVGDGDLTQGSVWHVLPKGLPQVASPSNLHHSRNTTPCLLPLQGHTQFIHLFAFKTGQILKKCIYPQVRHLCSTSAVEASSGKSLVVNRVLDNCEAPKPLLKTLH